MTGRFSKGEGDHTEQSENRQDTKRSETGLGQRSPEGINVDIKFDPRLKQITTVNPQPAQPTTPGPQTTPSTWERWRRPGAFVVGLAVVVGAVIALGQVLGWFD